MSLLVLIAWIGVGLAMLRHRPERLALAPWAVILGPFLGVVLAEREVPTGRP